MEVYVLPPPIHFSKRTFVKATDVMDEVSSATLRTCSIGTLLTSRMERTARREAIATFRQDLQSRDFSVRRRRNDPDIGRAARERASTVRGQSIRNIELATSLTVLEVPHQRRSIKPNGNGPEQS